MNTTCHIVEFDKKAKEFLSSISYTEVLYEFDDPLIVHSFYSNGTQSIDYRVCTGTIPDNFERWVVSTVSQRDFVWYVNGEKSLLQVLEDSKNIFIKDVFLNVDGIRAGKIKQGNLPKDYIPPENSFFVITNITPL